MLEWLQNPFISIAFAIGLMFFGYFFGLFEGRGQGYKRRQEEEAKEKDSEPVAEPMPVANSVTSPDETLLLDLSRSESGRLRLTLDGERTDPATLSTEQRKRLIEILTLVRPWLEASKPASPPRGTSPVAQHRSATPSQTVSSAKEVPPPVASRTPQKFTAPSQPEDDEALLSTPQSIVAQIDSILQTLIAGTPLIGRGIRLQESPEGGVIVWVGMKKYQGIEEVPDNEIQAAIRAAIAKWESKYTPGA